MIYLIYIIFNIYFVLKKFLKKKVIINFLNGKKNKMENAKKNININKEKNEIILKYKTNINNNKLKVFGEHFVKNNIRNCKMIIDKKEYKLLSYWNKNESNIINNILEIKLKIIKPLTNMMEMFSNCESLISFNDNNLNTSNVTNISYMFYECSNLSEISDISKWYTSNITDMNIYLKDVNY